MPSKLKFKGEKPKKRKREADDQSSKKQKGPQDGKEEESGWMTAVENDQLRGPVVIMNQEATCICADSEGTVYTSSELDQVNDSKNVVDRIEPNSVQQVFVLSPLEVSNERRYAFKSATKTYLSVKDSKFSAKASAIGAKETFEVEQYDGNGWTIKIHDEYLHITSDGSVKLSADKQKLAFRVQTKYAAKLKTELEVKERISTRELEDRVGRRLSDNEVRTLKKAFKAGHLNEALLDIRQKSRSDTRC